MNKNVGCSQDVMVPVQRLVLDV